MLSWKYRLLLCAGTLAAATWLGYRAEHRVMDSAGNNPVTFRSVVRRVMAPKSRVASIDRLNELRHLAGRSELTPREHAECWSIVRGFSVQDVEACLAEIPMKPPRVVNERLVSMLFFRWAQLDPLAAAEAAVGPAYQPEGTIYASYSNMASVATAWAAKDPEAALRWAAANDSPLAKNLVGGAAGKMMAAQDPDGAMEKATAILPASFSGVVIALAQRSDTSERRRDLLARLSALPDQQALEQYLNLLAWSPARQGIQDSPAVIEDMEHAGIAPERVATFREMALDSMRSRNPGVAIEAMQESAPGTSEKDQQYTYFSWALTKPGEATAWAVAKSRSDLASNLVQSNSMNLLRSGWIPGNEEPNNYLVQGVVSQFQVWRKLAPEAASAWLKTMPSDIRSHLSDDHAPR